MSRYLLGRRLWLPASSSTKRRARGAAVRKPPGSAKALARAAAQPGQSRLRFQAGARADASAAEPALLPCDSVGSGSSGPAAGTTADPGADSARDRHARAAERRGRVEANRGVGDVAHVAGRQAAAAKAASAGADEAFGAPVRTRLRRQLTESRAKGTLLKRRRAPVEEGRAIVSDVDAAEHAAALLVSFSAVRSSSGKGGVLQPKDVGSGGWCFFAAFHDQLGSGLLPGPAFSALLAI